MWSIHHSRVNKKASKSEVAGILLCALSSSTLGTSSTSDSSSSTGASSTSSSSSTVAYRPSRFPLKRGHMPGPHHTVAPAMVMNYPYQMGVMQNRAETHHIVNEALKEKDKKLEDRRNLVKKIGALITGLGANNMALSIRRQPQTHAVQQSIYAAQPVLLASPAPLQVQSGTAAAPLQPPHNIHFAAQPQVQQLVQPQVQQLVQPQVQQLVQAQVQQLVQQQVQQPMQIVMPQMHLPVPSAPVPPTDALMALSGGTGLCPYQIIKDEVRRVLPDINDFQDQKAKMAEREFENYYNAMRGSFGGAEWDAVKQEHDNWLRANIRA